MVKTETKQVDINDRIFPWKINLRNHPIVGSGCWQFKSLPELELFYGGNDTQIDNVESIIHYNNREHKFTKYEIGEVIPISSIRLLLKEVEEE